MIPGAPLYGFCIGNGYSCEKYRKSFHQTRKNSMKMTDFSRMRPSTDQIKKFFDGSTQKNQLVLNPRSKKYILRPNDELQSIRIFQKISFFAYFFIPIKIETPIFYSFKGPKKPWSALCARLGASCPSIDWGCSAKRRICQ